jgi:hypothetical protein
VTAGGTGRKFYRQSAGYRKFGMDSRRHEWYPLYPGEFANNDVSDSVHSTLGKKNQNSSVDVKDLVMGFIKFETGACRIKKINSIIAG